MILGIMLYLHFNRSRKVLRLAVVALTLIFLAFYLFGYGMQGSSSLFSPTIYADGPMLYSLGAVLIINLWLILLFFSTYLVRKDILEYVFEKNTRRRASFMISATVTFCILLLVYITFTFRSLILNSNIGLELYKITQLGRYTLYIYVSYLTLISVIPMGLQMIRVPVHRLTGLKYNMASRFGRTAFSVFCAVYFMSMFSILGREKEFSREEIWMNRLSIDRDLGLELQLRGIEKVIESDNSIPEVIFTTRDYRVILNRITETYMSRISKDYDVSLYIYKDKTSDPQMLKFIDERILNGKPIASDSRFRYSRNMNGRAQYAGMFVYYTPDKGSVRMLLGINSKADREERGYSFILDSGTPGSVTIPPLYSYAKYIDGKLVSYKGDYPYPTILSGQFKEDGRDPDHNRIASGSYVHFFNHVSPEEVVILSRPRISILQYILSASIVCLLTYFWISLCCLRRKRRGDFEKNYYKSRVNTVLFLRPTESLTVFLQQLGRGLRLAENKDCLTVLDFIGQANKKYNFEEKFAALLSNTTRSFKQSALAHAVDYAIRTYFPQESKNALHGEAVAVGLFLQLYYNQQAEQIPPLKDFMRKLEMPLTLDALGVPSTDENLQILEDYLIETSRVGEDAASRARLHEALRQNSDFAGRNSSYCRCGYYTVRKRRFRRKIICLV